MDKFPEKQADHQITRLGSCAEVQSMHDVSQVCFLYEPVPGEKTSDDLEPDGYCCIAPLFQPALL